MRLKSFLSGILLCLTILVYHNSVNAYGAFWYDKNVAITSLGKAMLFPLSDVNTPYQYKINPNEYSLEYKENDYLFKQFSKKIQKLKFYRMTPGLFEKEQITVDKYSDLLIAFPNEQARAAAVYDKTAADMYLVPVFRENRIQTDISPRAEFNVTLKSWTEVYNAPGYYHQTYTADERVWNEYHVIPETPVHLHIMALQFTAYNEHGDKIFTFVDSRRGYGTTEEAQFKNIVKYFRKDFNEVKGGKKFNERGTANGISIGFKNITVPPNVGNDEYYLKSAFFAMKDEAFKRLKNISIKYDANEADSATYYITGGITSCKLNAYWHEPSITISNSLIRTEESTWTDEYGKSHKQRTSYYTQTINDHLAGWTFSWGVSANLSLVDARTGQVVISRSYSDSDDKLMDCYRHVFKNFYGDVNKFLKRNK